MHDTCKCYYFCQQIIDVYICETEVQYKSTDKDYLPIESKCLSHKNCDSIFKTHL